MNASKLINTEYPRISVAATLMFAVLVVAWWLEVGLRISALAAIRFEFLMAGLCTLIALTRSAGERNRPGPGPNRDILGCIVALLIVQGLSLPLAVSFDLAWAAYLNRSVKYAVLGILIAQYVVSPGTLKTYLFASFLAFFKIGEEGFLGKITGSMVWESQGVPRLWGIQGSMFGHPNSLSGKFVSMMPFLWYLYSAIQAWWMKILVLIQVVFAINIIIFTASRTGYLTFIASTLLIVAFSKKHKTRVVALIVALAVAAVLFIPAEYQERFESSFTGKEKEGHSADTREGLLFDSMNAFFHNPLGVGPECFPYYQALGNRNAQETHNLYTQVLAETGIQGAIAFTALLVTILRKLSRTRRRLGDMVERLESHRPRAPPAVQAAVDSELRDGRFMLSTTTATIIFTYVRLLLGFLGHDLFEIYWWIAAGLAMALYKMLLVAEKRCTELIGAPVDAKSAAARRPGFPRLPVQPRPHG